MNDHFPGDLDEFHGLGLARLKPHGSPRRDVEPVAIGFRAVEAQVRVSFDEVIVAPDLDRAVAGMPGPAGPSRSPESASSAMFESRRELALSERCSSAGRS